MLVCPLCKKTLKALVRECPSCRTDLSLLADFLTHLQEGLTKAEDLTRAGELGEAVWAYLAVLEVDPENARARRQVGMVATAVRQFDKASPRRRWLRLRTQPGAWRSPLVIALVASAALLVGFVAGRYSLSPSLTVEPESPATNEKALK